MGRVNKSIEGVFTDIVGTVKQLSSYDVFIGDAKNASRTLKPFLETYRKSIIKNKSEFEKLAKLEEIIMQIRSRDEINDIKLSLVREYIYARCSFYRSGKKIKDIRVVADNTINVGKNIKALAKNKTFMDKAKAKLEKAMNKEIETKIASFQNQVDTLHYDNR